MAGLKANRHWLACKANRQKLVATTINFVTLCHTKCHPPMNQAIYQVDAFSLELYAGNPAAVCVLPQWIGDEQMQSIAMENNLAETAFVVKDNDRQWDLRWFTPTDEVDLCGHATLATAHVLYTAYGVDESSITFMTRSGALIVSQIGPCRYLMDFPTDSLHPIELSASYQDLVDVIVLEVYRGNDDYLLIVPDENAVNNAIPNLKAIKELAARGVIISAEGTVSDFSSRCFYPCVGVDEDPVTGSAHTTLTPYWAHRLRKNKLTARQLSTRGGNLVCIYKGSRTALIGEAVTYMIGMINISEAQY